MHGDTRIMVVDDDPVDVELTRRLLAGSRRMQFVVHTADDLRSAIQAIRGQHYDVLLLDLNLPGSRGLSTLDALRKECDKLPIIVLSGMNDEDTALRSLDHGAQDYLVKGQVTTDTLANSIRYAIQRQQLLQEITAAKELLEKKNRRLAELYETAHRFVDNVSHEFRTPLTVIKEYTSLVRDGLVDSAEQQRHFLDVVADRADDLNTMVDDMLDVSKLEAGLLGAWRRTCSVATIIEDLRPALERKASVKGIALELSVEPSLPDVYCDDEKVGRAIINLAVNAIKFCRDQGPVRLWARENSPLPGVMVGVTDNGPGINEEGLAKIFERFRQLDHNGSARGACKGFGLGLNIAKELVDLNLGELTVESQVDRGSTFAFTLPPAEPVEVIRRFLQRIVHLRNGPPTLSLVSATIDPPDRAPVSDDIDAYLHSLLRRNDLVYRVEETRWLLLVATGEFELELFYSKARRALNDMNRNRIHGPLPEVDMETLGFWRTSCDFQEVFTQLSPALNLRGVRYDEACAHRG